MLLATLLNLVGFGNILKALEVGLWKPLVGGGFGSRLLSVFEVNPASILISKVAILFQWCLCSLIFYIYEPCIRIR